VPPLALVELAQHHQEPIGGGVDVGGQFGDAVAETVELGGVPGGCGGYSP
jgi:hypothetical protein